MHTALAVTGPCANTQELPPEMCSPPLSLLLSLQLEGRQGGEAKDILPCTALCKNTRAHTSSPTSPGALPVESQTAHAHKVSTLPSPQLISPPHPFGNLQAASSHTWPPFTHPAQPPSHATPTPCVCAGTHEPSVFGTLHFSSSDTLPRHRFLISYTYVPTSSRLLLCTQMPITQAPHPSRASRAGGSWSQLHLLP